MWSTVDFLQALRYVSFEIYGLVAAKGWVLLEELN